MNEKYINQAGSELIRAKHYLSDSLFLTRDAVNLLQLIQYDKLSSENTEWIHEEFIKANRLFKRLRSAIVEMPDAVKLVDFQSE